MELGDGMEDNFYICQHHHSDISGEKKMQLFSTF